MVRILACAMTIALISTQLQAADQEAGKSLYSSNCAQCHGPTAKGMASFPSLAGREASYIQSRLETYRTRQNTHNSLSDEDIANLSAYISENFK